jgi:hypothetical protein
MEFNFGKDNSCIWAYAYVLYTVTINVQVLKLLIRQELWFMFSRDFFNDLWFVDHENLWNPFRRWIIKTILNSWLVRNCYRDYNHNHTQNQNHYRITMTKNSIYWKVIKYNVRTTLSCILNCWLDEEDCNKYYMQ